MPCLVAIATLSSSLDLTLVFLQSGVRTSEVSLAIGEGLNAGAGTGSVVGQGSVWVILGERGLEVGHCVLLGGCAVTDELAGDVLAASGIGGGARLLRASYESGGGCGYDAEDCGSALEVANHGKTLSGADQRLIVRGNRIS